MSREITRADILPMSEYGKIRKTRRSQLVETKRQRTMDVGPVATFFFESYDSMWLQIHEMLFIEKGGDGQIQSELDAYNPLVPKGDELVATVMFQIDDPIRRKNFLARLGGVEDTAFIQFAGETVMATPETDTDRTAADGKASAVQFLHFNFTPEQIEKFRTPETQVIIGFKHPAYAHMAVMLEGVRMTLAEDFA